MANDNNKLTITLTGHAPICITKDEWPILATGEDIEYDNEYEFQASRKASWKVIVRQHEDGRVIVYAIHKYETHWRGESGRDIRGGELLPANGTDAIIAAIMRVTGEIENRMPDEKWSRGIFPRLAHECVADLPAVEI